MQTSALMPTCGRPASSSDIAREWLVKFAEICQKQITSALAGIWAEQLEDIPAELLNRACEQLAKTWGFSFLPTPGNIRAQIEKTNHSGLQLEAEEAWCNALAWIQEWWHPDIGFIKGAPDLPAAAGHAVRAAGGFRFLFNCSDEELQWAKKRFIEDFVRIHEMGEDKHLLSRVASKGILATLTSGSPRMKKALQSPLVTSPVVPTESDEDHALKSAFEQARTVINELRPNPKLVNAEEIENRKREQRARLDCHLREHPELLVGVPRVEK